MIERTFVAIKPDAVRRGLIGEIIRRFEQRGLKIAGMRMMWVDDELVEKHYFEHREKPFFNNLKEYLTSGPVVAMVVEGANAISVVRKIVGPTSGSEAPPGTIRGDYGHMDMKHADENNKLYYNLIHASDSKESAEREINIWFRLGDLHSYKRVDEEEVM
ncbi:MAG: nucleoside-diphosphate kinase [Candidatus Aenigmarchaeota archaeon ex4484_56]|nr:MAG: nucleoside-diphosphate kinase [Candidatus Aenigmarchaeota archaeon ex4484_56]